MNVIYLFTLFIFIIYKFINFIFIVIVLDCVRDDFL